MFSNLDITYCSNTNCNKHCERNQNNLNPIIVGNHPISISEMKDCEFWEVEDEKES